MSILWEPLFTLDIGVVGVIKTWFKEELIASQKLLLPNKKFAPFEFVLNWLFSKDTNFPFIWLIVQHCAKACDADATSLQGLFLSQQPFEN